VSVTNVWLSKKVAEVPPLRAALSLYATLDCRAQPYFVETTKGAARRAAALTMTFTLELAPVLRIAPFLTGTFTAPA